MAGTNIYGPLVRAQLENSASDLTPTATGLFYFNTTSGLKWYTGSAWTTAADLTSSQVFTNKDFDGGTASNTSRVTLPKAATATLNALTRKQGTVVYDTTTGQVKYDDGATLTALSASVQATATTLGVVQGGTVPGSTSGVAIGSGYIGQVLSSVITTLTDTGANNTYYDATSLPITTGIWRVDSTFEFKQNTGTFTSKEFFVGISTSSGSSSTGLDLGVNLQTWDGIPLGQATMPLETSPLILINDGTTITRAEDSVAFAAGQTIYLKSKINNFTSGQPQFRAKLTAVRIG